MIYARLVGKNGMVLAVEAEPFHADMARRNKNLNGVSQIEIVQAAAIEYTGRLPIRKGFNRSVRDRLLDWRGLGVSGVSLDDLTIRYGSPDVLLVDVDGFECQVLRGGASTLSGLPDCMVEVHVGAGLEQEGGTIDQVLSFFPTDVWDLWAAPGNWSEFVPFHRHLPLTRRRFMLVAMAAKKSKQQPLRQPKPETLN